MTTHLPATVLLKAEPQLDKFGRHLADRRGRPLWNLPKPIRQEPHWVSAGMKRKALARGLDKMTAGAPFVVMVPVYRGVSATLFRDLKNQAAQMSKAQLAFLRAQALRTEMNGGDDASSLAD